MGLLKPRNLMILAFLAVTLLPKIQAECDPELEYTCSTGLCIPHADKCNNHEDCPNGDDEEDCEKSTVKPPHLKSLDSSVHGVNYIAKPCKQNEFKCESDGVCVAGYKVCNNYVDCSDQSDEKYCDNEEEYEEGADCHESELPCDENKCISPDSICDSINDCDDGADEENCPPPTESCRAGEFQCENFDCVSERDRCNGLSDCGDNSDEKDCSECSRGNFHCQVSRECIADYKQCDGTIDCEDQTDEDGCEIPSGACSRNQFRCNNGECLNQEFVCDGNNDCLDSSDEFDEICRGIEDPDHCEDDQFFCSGKCIEQEKRCDGIPDCDDYSDENDCPPQTESPEPEPCPEDQCADGTCIYQYQRCDGRRDCAGGEDESGCPCHDNQFQCDDGSCIQLNLKCNRRYDCRDGSDERHCPPQPRPCRSGDFQCRTGECINESRKCDQRVDCQDGSDESDCPPPPRTSRPPITPRNPDPRYTTPDPRYTTPDPRYNTPDPRYLPPGPDDWPPTPPPRANLIPTPRQHTTPDPRYNRPGSEHRGDIDPYNRYHTTPDPRYPPPDSDNWPPTPPPQTNLIPTPRQHTTPDPNRIALGPPGPCSRDQWQCASGECIPSEYHCDNRPDCRDQSDEDNCSLPTERPQQPGCSRDEWLCNSGDCIPLRSHCDGRRDCPDYSDERNCPPKPEPGRPGLNLKTYPNEQIIKERLIKEGREVVFQCRDEGPIRARVQWVRRGGRPLPSLARDNNGRLEIPNIQLDQQGEYICEAVGYPKNQPGSSVSVHLTVEKYNRTEFYPHPACSANQATCQNGDCISKAKICDGHFDCTDGSDENNCRDRCEPNEYKCHNKKCVLKTWRCDGENDCGDNSDEEGCSSSTPSSGPCRYDEFQCADRQCIPKSFQCDSQSDCRDNSDEIGCISPAVITPPPPMVRLSAGFVFNITCRATGNPIPLIVWRLNWGHIPDKCQTTSVGGFGTLTCPDIQPVDSGAYSCEIINSMGTHFVSPDTILVVTSDDGPVCPVGHFNRQAQRREDCINCFCFGVTTQCTSADLFTYSLNPPVTSQTVVGVDGPWNGLRGITIGEYDRHTLTSSRHGVQFRAADIPAATNRVYPYLALPSDYQGNQLKSYGGYLRYEVEFNGRGGSNDIPDVILEGNGYTLTYRSPSRFYPNTRNNVTVQLFANNWYKLDGSYASREEVMMALANVENILIKLQYIDSGERNVELLHVTLDSAALRNAGLGSASLVEECRCPIGYSGLSCESCDVGYVRQKEGLWLGRCVRESEPCRPGTYGDPNNGIPCKACPCPTVSQSRARTCSLDRSNGDVICNCERGYVGKRCEECAFGYDGDGLRGCYQKPVSECDPFGTDRVLSNGRCECKRDVVGARCDQCSSGSYYLNQRSGCINCFCMGVTSTCSSTTLVRDAIKASFTSTQSGFSVVSGYEDPTSVADRLAVRNREIAFSNFDSESTYYWSLPASFLGNKLTSYGGKLTYTVRYTPQPSGGASRSNAPDIVIVSGNGITLHHYRQDSLPPSGSQTFSVPVFEEEWQHYTDGVSANRQHLLMALANVTAIYIKATYTTVAEEAGLSGVELEIASEQSPGSSQRAWEVEQCSCPTGHQGLSCEDCLPGYFKSDQGLYLGLCERCECNGHSDECDSKTGICINCRGNTYGDNCEVCLPGFTGNATSGGCQQASDLTGCNDCSAEGTSSCDIRRRTCNCKPNVQGQRCEECREGSFGLSATNELGCNECFCSGATKSCSSGTYFRDEIPLFVIDDTFRLTDRDGNNELPSNLFEMVVEENEIAYTFNDDLAFYFWNLPDRLTGNLILSYGGNLKITQKTDGDGKYVEDQDVIIKGNGLTLFYSRPNYEEETYSVPLIESHWRTINRNGPRPASRADLLTALSNVDSILVRASLRTYTLQSRISDISLETAVRQRTSEGRVYDIELCRCPDGYKGSSCEQCDALYYRDVFDRSAGLQGSCKRCPCDNAESCEMGSNRRIQCRCMPGWTGDYCRERAGQPPTARPTLPPSRPPTIKVVINTPSIKIVEIGETTEFNCNGYYVINNAPVTIRWYKFDGDFSERTHVDRDRGSLFIQDAQIDDSGVYICQAQVGSEIVRNNVTLTVGAAKMPRVTITPSIVQKEENSVVDVYCSATGAPEPRIEWTRLDGQMPSNVVIRDGHLRFNSLSRADEGFYQCFAQNEVGETDQTLQVYISRRAEPPTSQEEVNVSPDRYDGEPGEEIVLRCVTNPRGRVTWTKSGSVQLPRNVQSSGDELIIRQATADDSGRYICNIQFPSGNTRTAFGDVTIVSRANEIPPRISTFEQKYSVVQGGDFELVCESTGTPYPTIEWSINGAQFESNARQTGNVLRILNARPENSGVYICLASNNAGSDQAATIIDVERRDPPVIELFPKEPQKLRVGESTRLSCRATSGTPYPTITWSRRDGKPLSSRFSEDYPGVITLRDATIDDAGSYECKAHNAAGSTTLTTSLEIQQPPTISITPDRQSFDLTEGDDLRFICAATGFPPPTVTIKVPESAGRAPLPSFSPRPGAGGRLPSRPEATVNYSKIKKLHAGLYECVASNEAGQDTKYIQVNVGDKRGDVGVGGDDENPDDNEIDVNPNYRPYPPPDHELTPIDPPPRGSQSTFTVHLGERAEFNCNSEDNSMRTEWRRADGRQLPYGARIYGGQLVIENVRSDAAGIYECSAYDHISRRPITLLVASLVVIAGPPKITFSPPMPIKVKAGEDVIIYCNATGEGPLRVIWHGDGGYPLPNTIDISGNYLRFNRIAPADAGRYVCTATNIYGNTTKVAEVIVNNNQPEVPSYGRTKEAYEGDTVSLTCSDENPRGQFSRFEWEREYTKLPPLAENRDNILILYNTRHDDQGRYICKSYAEDGTVTQNYVDLVIKPPIPFLKLNPPSGLAKPGDNVEVVCTSSAGPHVRVSWARADGRTLPFNFQQSGNRLTVINAQKYDSGKYNCICHTDEGQEYMSEYELLVEDSPATLRTPKVEHAEVGATVLLRCNSQRPMTTYTWSRQHGTFPPDLDTSSEILKLINVQASDAGTYICSARHNGQVVEVPTTLVVTGAIPFFIQSPRSYMKFAKLDQAYSKFNFEITFKPERADGLILYNGQKRAAGDYIALSLVDGIPQFRYSFGDQQGILSPEKPLENGQWHTIKVNRVRTNGWMIVDDQHPVVFPPNQKFQGLNLEEELYLGGVPKFEHIAPSASDVKTGFIGCISRLVLNERDIQLNQEAIYVEGTTSCEVCADEPCLNDGVCLETQTEHGYTCVCNDGFTGKNCQVEGFQCSLGVCGVGRCGETETGIECYCPLNRTGNRCEYNEHYKDEILSFRDGSYSAYDKLTGKKNIKLKIRPETDNDGVILYAAESDRAFGDFIAIVIKDKHIEFRYIVGGKVLPVIIRSKDPVKVGEWMDVSVGRSRAGLGYLQVDNEPQINEPKGTGRAQTLYLKTYLYVGGYDKRIVLNRGVGVIKGFQGCVAGLEIAGKGVNMISELRDAANVQNCGHSFVIDDDSSGDYESTSNAPHSCRPGYVGRECEIIVDVCAAHEPCENGGICTQLPGKKYACDCTLGFTGDHCQHMVNLETSAQFRGNGYLELDHHTISNSTSQLTSGIAILFSTRQPNGLLLWYGQVKGRAFQGEDFLALAVNDGILEFYFRLDGQESFIRHHGIRVDTGTRHVAVLKRRDNQASLELDGLTEYGETRPTPKKEIILPGHIFLGGAPNIKSFTGDRYIHGFVGCIHVVESLDAQPIQLGLHTISSLNVDSCSTNDEDELDNGTEPPVV